MVSVLQFWCQPHEVLCKGSIITHKLLYKTNMFAFIFVWKLSRPPITNWKQIKCSLKLAWEDSGMVTRRKIDFWNFNRFILIAICVLIFYIISHELVANWLAKEVVTTQKWDRSGTPETLQPKDDTLPCKCQALAWKNEPKAWIQGFQALKFFFGCIVFLLLYIS